MALLYLLAVLVAAAGSTPRRVGDGGEYFVMALQLAAGRPPSISAGELRETKTTLSSIGGGFDTSLLEYPDLVGADGRQDFLHFFLYSLIVAPLLPLVSAVGLHPNWAFTLINALLLAAAVSVVASRGALVVAVAGFASPIIWWVDKAHTEAFLFAMVAVAAMLFRQQPSVALIAFALAGTQNAALAVTYPLFAVLLWRATAGGFSRIWLAVSAGAMLVALPFLYTWVRLGQLSPMAEYAQRTLPSVGGLAAFVAEPNIGILPNAPVYALAMTSALWLGIRAVQKGDVPPLWWWPAAVQVALLVLWSQNPNANHGGTPGMNRWVLSLLALSLPWLAEARPRLTAGTRVAFNIVLAVTAVMTAAAHLPGQPESYREPTRLAARLWDAGLVHVTPAEVFAERAQGREPAFAPSHDGGCRVILIANQQAPVQCAPPTEPLPASCRASGAMCYAIADGDRWRYVSAPANGFFYQVAEPSWPAGGPLAAGIHRVLGAANPAARVWRAENPRRWRERISDADIGVVLSSPGVTVVHIERLSAAAKRRLVDDRTVTVTPLISSGTADAGSALTNLAVVIRR